MLLLLLTSVPKPSFTDCFVVLQDLAIFPKTQSIFTSATLIGNRPDTFLDYKLKRLEETSKP